MNHLLVASTGFGLMLITMAGSAGAAEQCPRELAQANAALKSAQASLGKGSRTYAGAKSQEIQAPRSQDVQAPRQDVIQAPRAQDIQAPRSQQEVPVPRGQEQIQAPRVSQAATLVQESENACKSGDMATSTSKAKEALNLLKK